MKIGPPLQPFDPGLLTFSRLSKTCVTCVYAARESQPARCGLAALALGPNSALAVAAGLLFNSTPPPHPPALAVIFSAPPSPSWFVTFPRPCLLWPRSGFGEGVRRAMSTRSHAPGGA